MAAGERTVRIRFDGTTSGLTTAAAKARAELKALQKQADEGKKNLDNLASGILGAAKNFGQLAASTSQLATGINLVVGLGTALITAAGAAPLAVSGVLALGAALITTKLGADGIKKAFDGLTPSLNNLKKSVSSSFESSLTPAVNNLKTVLPQVTDGFQQIATAMGGALTKVTLWLKTPAAIGQVNTILGGTGRLVQNLGSFLQPVIAAFVRIGSVATPILVGLTANLGNIGQKFQDWVDRMADSGNITQWINNAVELFKSLWSTLKDIGSIVSSVFGALEDSGAGLSGVFGPVVGQIKDFVQSAQGHDTIVALAQAVQQVGEAVGKVLGAALKAVGPEIPTLAKAFGDLATSAASSLVPAIENLTPLVHDVIGFIADHAKTIGDFAPIILGVAGAFKIWTGFIKPATEAFKVLNTVLASNPFVAIATVVVLVATLIITHWTQISAFLSAAWNAIQSAAETVWNAIAGFFTTIWNAISGTAQAVWGAVAGFFVGLWNGIRDTAIGVWNAITGALSSAWNWVSGVAQSIWNGVSGFFSGIWNGIRDTAVGIWNGIKGAFSSFADGIGNIVGRIKNFFVGIWDGITSGLKSAVNGAIHLINGLIGGVNRITGAVGIPAIPSIPYLARGGTAQAGHPYLVGERGPELFMPGRTGRVVNANTTAQAIGGGAKTINLTLDLGAGIQQRMAIELDAHDRATVRALATGSRRSR